MLQCPIKFYKKKHTLLLLRKTILSKTLHDVAARQEPFYFGIKVITRPMYWYIKWSHPWEEIIKKCVLPELYISIHKEWHSTQRKVIKWNCFLRRRKNHSPISNIDTRNRVLKCREGMWNYYYHVWIPKSKFIK